MKGLGYTGYRHEQDLGLVDARGRFYDPKFGMFLSADPIGPLNGASRFGNRYAYVGYDPLNFVDPSGLDGEDCTERQNQPGCGRLSPWAWVIAPFTPEGRRAIGELARAIGDWGVWDQAGDMFAGMGRGFAKFFGQQPTPPEALHADFGHGGQTFAQTHAAGVPMAHDRNAFGSQAPQVHDSSWSSGSHAGRGGGSGHIGDKVPIFPGETCPREDTRECQTIWPLAPILDMAWSAAQVSWSWLFGGAEGASSARGLTSELAAQGVKFTAQNVVAIERIGGRIIFLESGTAQSGLTHILARHASDFAAKGVAASEIPGAVMTALRAGTVIGGSAAKPIYEFVFNGGIQRMAVVVGSNGYIVTAHPATP